MTRDNLSMWIVYDRPLDYPNEFVVRRWDIVRGQPEPVMTLVMYRAASLDGVRGHIPEGLYRMPRWEGDEPHIVEVWL